VPGDCATWNISFHTTDHREALWYQPSIPFNTCSHSIELDHLPLTPFYPSCAGGGTHTQQFHFLNGGVGFDFPRNDNGHASERLVWGSKHGVSVSLEAWIYDNWHFLHPTMFIS
jgi:hypothetical protein